MKPYDRHKMKTIEGLPVAAPKKTKVWIDYISKGHF